VLFAGVAAETELTNADFIGFWSAPIGGPGGIRPPAGASVIAVGDG
jgi:hypothetical protein